MGAIRLEALTSEGYDFILNLRLLPQQAAVFLGPNGSGKSSLLYNMYKGNFKQEPLSWMPGYRNIYFSSDDYALTATEAERYYARPLDYYGVKARSQTGIADATLKSYIQRLVFFDAQENQVALDKARLSKERGQDILKDYISPIRKLNNLFVESGFEISFSVSMGVIKAWRRGVSFSVTETSDGERAALLLGCAVISEEGERCFIIDEPEKHLNPLISHSFLSRLVKSNPKASFIFGTHDLELADAIGATAIFSTRTPDNYGKVQIEDITGTLDEPNSAIKTAIRGGRRNVVFIEGTRGSLDNTIYSALISNASIQPVGSCNSVIAATTGINRSTHVHWIEARGIIDRDGRADADTARLKSLGIYTLRDSSIESMLCHPKVFRKVGKILSISEGILDDIESRLVKRAKTAAIDDAVARLATWELERRMQESLPKASQMRSGDCEKISFDPNDIFLEVRAGFSDLKKMKSFEEIVENLPVKHSIIPGELAVLLGFKSFSEYAHDICRRIAVGEGASRELKQAILDRLPAEVRPTASDDAEC